MINLKKIFALIATFAILLAAPIAKAWTKPSGSLNVEMVNSANYYVRAFGSFSDSYDWGSTLYWGDGSQVTFPGGNGDYNVYHYYANSGTYTISLRIEGQGGSTTYSYTVNLSKTVSGNMNVVVVNPLEKEIKADVTYSDSYDWGATIYWGHDNSFVRLPGNSGTYSLYHKFPTTGLYTISFVVEGTGGPVVVERQVDFQAATTPVSAEMNLEVTNMTDKIVKISGSYANSYDWGTAVYWGHDGSFVRFPGTSGTFEEYHQFPSLGSYTVSLVAEGNNGPVIINKEVVFEGLTNPAVGDFSVEIVNPAERKVRIHGTYANSYDWGTTVYWGHDDSLIRFPGESGTFDEFHQFPSSGTFTISLVVEGIGGPHIVERSVSFN